MIQSMTGYGKATAEVGNRKVIVEIKSLNSKAMDISTKIIPAYRDKELDIRSRITAALERGKVDFALYIDSANQTGAQTINAAIFNNYLQQIESIAAQTDYKVPEDIITTVLRMPEVISSNQQDEVSDEEWTAVSKAVDSAIAALVEYRKAEGVALEKKFREKISNISALLKSVEPYEQERVAKIKERIRTAMQNTVGSNYDENRFEQEMIFYIEKLDISEEKQRLTNHLDYFIKTLEEGHGQGKKLGFIAQEMGREINTLGSKSNQAEMQNIVVRMKDELEQIKEQVLNVMCLCAASVSYSQPLQAQANPLSFSGFCSIPNSRWCSPYRPPAVPRAVPRKTEWSIFSLQPMSSAPALQRVISWSMRRSIRVVFTVPLRSRSKSA